MIRDVKLALARMRGAATVKLPFEVVNPNDPVRDLGYTVQLQVWQDMDPPGSEWGWWT